mmetsp:Transcript_47703/g.145084  ORF Transcript_47703/g.145084 Transcript_47703/m.145084 type:complete len:319 (+) Transcript_47703:170-1126(+)
MRAISSGVRGMPAAICAKRSADTLYTLLRDSGRGVIMVTPCNATYVGAMDTVPAVAVRAAIWLAAITGNGPSTTGPAGVRAEWLARTPCATARAWPNSDSSALCTLSIPCSASTSRALLSMISPGLPSVSFPPASTWDNVNGRYSDNSSTNCANQVPSVPKIATTSSSKGRSCIATIAARCSALPSTRCPVRASKRLKKLRCVPATPCATPGSLSVSWMGTFAPGSLGRPTMSLPNSKTPPPQQEPSVQAIPPASPVPQERNKPRAAEPSPGCEPPHLSPSPGAPHMADASPSLTSKDAQAGCTRASDPVELASRAHT